MRSTLSVAALLSGASAASIGLTIDPSSNKVIATSSSPQVTASYTNTTEGWFYLDINSPEGLVDSEERAEIMRLVGYAEGYLTCNEMKTYYPNYYEDSIGSGPPPPEVVDFMTKNYNWMYSMAEQHYESDSFWAAVRGILVQLNGIVEGYANSPCASSKQRSATYKANDLSFSDNDDITLFKLILSNAWGDLYTIQTKFMLEKASDIERARWVPEHGYGGKARRIKYPGTPFPKDLRCSSLVKLLPDYSDVFFGHTTWDSFGALAPRSIKHVSVPSLTSTGVRNIYYSSSPGLISSVDDYYTVTGEDSLLTVIETTNDLLVPSLFEKVVPQSVLSWVRATAANTLGVDGPTWADAFSVHHSGTYTNQWQVLNLRKFSAGSAPEAGFFTVLEEIPLKVHTEDMTQFLIDNAYWPSYNIPYFPDIYRESGNEAACKAMERPEDGSFCYEHCARANIFRARQSTVTDVDSMKKMINYNDWKNDPLSEGDACNAIACRGDLNHDGTGYPSGGLDGKVSSATTIQNFYDNNGDVIMHARLGPTHDDQEPFCWSNVDMDITHDGQPNCFTYNWISFPV